MLTRVDVVWKGVRKEDVDVCLQCEHVSMKTERVVTEVTETWYDSYLLYVVVLFLGGPMPSCGVERSEQSVEAAQIARQEHQSPSGRPGLVCAGATRQRAVLVSPTPPRPPL